MESHEHLLPVMPLRKVKLPLETVSLQLFEPRYRLLFKLVKQSKSRLFGLVLADQQLGMMESIGCLCELTHYIPVPRRYVSTLNQYVSHATSGFNSAMGLLACKCNMCCCNHICCIMYRYV